MWTFDNVAAGTHDVSAHAEVRAFTPADGGTGRKGSAGVDHCAFTVFVIPAVP